MKNFPSMKLVIGANIFVFSMLFFSVSVSASTITINQTSIQDAINSASDGDIISVEPGNYSKFILNKSLSVVGKDYSGVFVIGNYTVGDTLENQGFPTSCVVAINDNDVSTYGIEKIANVVSITSPDSRVENLTVKDSRGYFGDTLIFSNQTNVTVKDIKLENGCIGVKLEANDSVVDNVDFNITDLREDSFGNYRYNGFFGLKLSSSNNTIMNSKIPIRSDNGQFNNYSNNDAYLLLKHPTLASKTERSIKLFTSSNNTFSFNTASYIQMITNSKFNTFNQDIVNFTVSIDGINQVNIEDFSTNINVSIPALKNITFSNYLNITTTDSITYVIVRIYFDKNAIQEHNDTLVGKGEIFDIADLTIKSFNETSNKYQNEETTINFEEGYVETNTTHFSVYVVGLPNNDAFDLSSPVIESSSTVQSSSSSGGGGGGSYRIVSTVEDSEFEELTFGDLVDVEYTTTSRTIFVGEIGSTEKTIRETEPSTVQYGFGNYDVFMIFILISGVSLYVYNKTGFKMRSKK